MNDELPTPKRDRTEPTLAQFNQSKEMLLKAEWEKLDRTMTKRGMNTMGKNNINPLMVPHISRAELKEAGLPIGDIILLEGAYAAISSHPCFNCWKLKENRCSGEGDCESARKASRSNEQAPTEEGPSTSQPTLEGKKPRYKSIIPSVLPTWDPDVTVGTAKEYIQRLKMSFEAQAYDPQKWHIALLLQMKGKAEPWAIRVMKDKSLTWKSAKKQFLATYTSSAERTDKFRTYYTLSQKKGEKVRDYVNRFRVLSDDLDRDPNDEQTIDQFVKGLNPEIRAIYVSTDTIMKCTSLDQATLRAIKIDGASLKVPDVKEAAPDHREGKRSKKKERTPPPGGCSKHYWLKRTSPNFHSTAECKANKKKEEPKPQEPAQSNKPEKKKKHNPFNHPKGSCYNCGKTGHLRPDCPDPSLFSMEAFRHIEEATRAIESLIDLPKESIGGMEESFVDDHPTWQVFENTLQLDSIQTEQDNPDGPILIPITIENINTIAYVDTGCSNSFIDENFAKNNGIFFNSDVIGNIQLGKKGTSVPRIGITNTVNLITSTHQISTKLEVMPLRYPIFLGRSEQRRLGIGMIGLPRHHVTFEAPAGPVVDTRDALVEGATPHPEHARVMEAIREPLQTNSRVNGFVPLHEALVHVRITDKKPLYQRQYKIAQRFHEGVSKAIAEWLEKGVIKKIDPGSWNSPLTVSQKKDPQTGGKSTDPLNIRVNFDGRAINKRIPDYSFELPLISDILEKVGGHEIYSTIDLKDAFCTFKVADADQEILAFNWAGQHYCWVGAPFGLKILSFQFQKVMNLIFCKNAMYTAIFIDDICVFSKDVQSHIEQVKEVITLLTNNNFKINTKKSAFAFTSIHLLGHKIDKDGIQIDRRKLAGIMNWPRPTATTIESYMGLCNYFRSFVPNYARVTAPLNQVRKTFSWGAEQEAAWKAIRELLVNSPIINMPDFSRPFYVATDASKVGIGGVLFQKIDDSKETDSAEANRGNHNYISFVARSCQGAERNYSATKREALAIVFSLLKFRYFLIGRHFKVYTDHRALIWLFDQYESNRITNTWFDTLIEYDFSVIHLPGIINILPDCLSRLFPASEGSDITTMDLNHIEVDLETILKFQTNSKNSHNILLRHLKRNLKISKEILIPHQGNKISKSQKWKEHSFVDATKNTLLIEKLLKQIMNTRLNVFVLIPKIKRHKWLELLSRCQCFDLEHFPYSLVITNSKSTDSAQEASSSNSISTISDEREVDVVVDLDQQKDILTRHHAFGHFGSTALCKSICEEKKYWSGMIEDCKKFVANCTDCQRYTIHKKGYHPLQPILARLPWDHISFDLFQLRTSSCGYNYVLIVVDVCTRMCFLRAIKTKSMRVIAKKLFKLFTDIGFPRILQSDNGSEFVNKVVASMVKTCAQNHRTITPYNPRANGLSERFVRTAKDTLLKELRGAETEWVEKIPLVQLAMNYKISALHGSSPFSYFYGRKFNFFGNYKESISAPASLRELEERMHKLETIIYPALADKSAEVQGQRKTIFDQTSTLVNLPAGTYVMARMDEVRGKGSARYEGPFKVIDRSKGGAYKLMDSDGTVMQRRFAPAQLKPISVVEEEQTPTYVVERILRDKRERGKRFYYVKWQNYDEASNSWVNEDDFADVEVVRNYWRLKNQKSGIRP